MCGDFYPGSPAVANIPVIKRMVWSQEAWFKSQHYYLLLCDLSELLYFTVSVFSSEKWG